MSLKKLLSAVALCGITAFSCSAQESIEINVSDGGNGKLIYIITPSHANPFFKTEAHVAADTARDLGYTVKICSHDDNLVKQSELFEAAISDGAVAIICDNAGAEGTTPAVKRAKDNGVPTFLIDREINETGFAVAQIVSNNYQGAKAVAEAFVQAMGEEGEYAELYGLESDANAKIRSAAFHEVLDKYPKLRRVTMQIANWDQNLAYQKTERILSSYPNIKGIISGNDNMAVGATEAVIASSKPGIKIVGFDGSNDAAKYIRNDKMVATALQPIADIAALAVYEVDDYLKKGSTGKSEKQQVDCVVINKDNVFFLNDFTLAQ
ncbi:MAG: D-ribose ABC transporter substrate-binding protein [Succinivibrio sp.]|nr:D-ribose ABC transporter substrate-binding protein [Succinivibrio sp.]